MLNVGQENGFKWEKLGVPIEWGAAIWGNFHEPRMTGLGDRGAIFFFFFKSKVFASVLRLADGFSSSRWKLEFFSARGSLHASSVGSLIVGHSLHRFAIESYRLSLVAALFESESTNRWIDGADVSRKFECQKSHLTAADFDWTLKPAEFACNCICWSVRMYLLL